MPRYLISDVHEWINDIPTVPYLVPRRYTNDFAYESLYKRFT